MLIPLKITVASVLNVLSGTSRLSVIDRLTSIVLRELRGSVGSSGRNLKINMNLSTLLIFEVRCCWASIRGRRTGPKLQRT
jgi:hypothetical protein